MLEHRKRFAPALEQITAWQLALGRAREESSGLSDPFVSRELDNRLRDVVVELREVEESEDVDAALLEALERTVKRLTEASSVIAGSATAGGAARRTIDVLSAILRAIREARLPTADAAGHGVSARSPRPADPPAASIGTPRVFDPPRQAILLGAGRQRAIEDPCDPAQAWRLFPPPAFVGSRSAPRVDAAERDAERQLRRSLDATLDEIGSLGGLRACGPDEAWIDGTTRFESRLLANRDAADALCRPRELRVASAGEPWRAVRVHLDIGVEVARWAEDALPGDTRRAFCRGFVLGCLRGGDAARSATAALSDPDVDRRDATADALALASSPDLSEAIRAACRDPSKAASALDVARRRGETDVATAALALAVSERATGRAAARALAASSERARALAVLAHAVEAGLDPVVELAACESALALGAAWPLRSAREHAAHLPADDELLSGWLRLLAVAGDQRDATLLRERAGDIPERIEIWGFHGSVALASALVERIVARPRGADSSPHLDALARITGIVPTDPHDPATVQRAWNAMAGSLDPSLRYRRGQPFTLVATLEELHAYGGLQRERRMLALEASLLSAGAIRLDTDDWASRQRALLDSALQQAKSMRTPSGEFGARALR